MLKWVERKFLPQWTLLNFYCQQERAGCEIKGKKENFCDLTPWSSLRQSKQMNKTERLGSKKFTMKSVYEEFWVFDVHTPKHPISTLWCSGESPCLSGENPEFHSRTSRVCWVPTLRRASPLSEKKKATFTPIQLETKRRITYL